MSLDHLVVLGVKANSWAWGIEQSVSLMKEGISVSVLDFDMRSRSSPRSKFRARVITEESYSIIFVREIYLKEVRRRINQKAKLWITSNSSNPNWIESKIDGLPIGRIIMSNYARIAGTSDFDLNLVPRNLQLKIVSLALLADFAYAQVANQFTEISISNGRSPIEAVFLIRARENNQKVNVIERGSTTKKWFVYKTSPHYSPDWWQMLRESASKANRPEFKLLSTDYWRIRLEGWDELSGRDWRKEFETGKVPPRVDNNSVVFFCTSQHEVPVVKEFECSNLGFRSQQLAVRELADLCKKLGRHLVIKRHPNSLGLRGVDRESPDWEWLKSLNDVTYLEADSKVDTNALIRRAGVVLTYRSSVGVEASAMRFPARAMGPAEWAYCEEARVWDRQSLESFLRKPVVLDPIIHESWGFLASTFGAKLECFSDITGGYAVTSEGIKIYSADHYDQSLRKLFLRMSNKIWSMRPRS